MIAYACAYILGSWMLTVVSWGKANVPVVVNGSWNMAVTSKVGPNRKAGTKRVQERV